MSAQEQLDELKVLHLDATRQPWEEGDRDTFAEGYIYGGNGEHVATAEWINNTALIVAAVNALPGHVAAIEAVLNIHSAVDAVQYLGARQIPRKVCAGCGSDDGNWMAWPCPTVRAITEAL